MGPSTWDPRPSTLDKKIDSIAPCAFTQLKFSSAKAPSVKRDRWLWGRGCVPELLERGAEIVHVPSRMSKSLVDLCMFCVAKNLENIDRVGSFLCKNDNELVLELLCDHDMFTGSRMPYITTELLTSRLENIAFRYSGQVDDTLLQKVALSRCKLKSFILKDCLQVSGELRWHAQGTSPCD